MTDSDNGFEGWAILELMGHRRLGGRVSEATIAGGAFLRIDIPHPNQAGMFTASQFYSPGAVYAITPTTEEIACAIARGAPQPVSRWDLPAYEGLRPVLAERETSAAIVTLLNELDEDEPDLPDEPDFAEEEDDGSEDTGPMQRFQGGA
ncbi:MAG: hypothetical protein ACRDJC_10570 [Thermomicrobiales bacterium]